MNKQLLMILLLFLGNGFAQDEAHDDHEEHEEGLVALSAAQMASLNLDTVKVRRGKLTDTVSFPSEIQFDPTRVAHLTPRVQGIVREVRFGLGDTVEKGTVLAVLESRELGMMKSNYLAALAREGLRRKTYEREKRLWEKGISAEQEFQEAEQALAEARIATRQAREALYALTLSPDAVEALPNQGETLLNRYRMTMPFTGKIIEQHITMGEVLKKESAAFMVADTSEVWVMARVPERDLQAVRSGQKGIVTLNGLPQEIFTGQLDYIGSQLDRDTRTAQARLVLPNHKDLLRAGMFGSVNVFVPSPRQTSGFLIPKAALQRVNNGFVVFRNTAVGSYQMVAVEVVAENNTFAEILGELGSDDQLATGDLFILKSQVGKEEMGEGHSH